MTTILIEKTVFDGWDEAQKVVMLGIGEGVGLGDPAVLVDENGAEWLAFDDGRINAAQVAVFGAAMAQVSTFRGGRRPKRDDDSFDRAALVAQARDEILDSVVPPEEIEVAEGEDALTEILSAQGAPASVRAGSGVPDGLRPKVEDEET